MSEAVTPADVTPEDLTIGEAMATVGAINAVLRSYHSAPQSARYTAREREEMEKLKSAREKFKTKLKTAGVDLG